MKLMMKLDNKKNIPWINTLKAICIILVFMRHCELFYGYQIGWFNCITEPIYVNAFFLVSGYLLFKKQLSDTIMGQNTITYIHGGGKLLATNVLYRIMIPSTIFALIEFVPKNIIRNTPINAVEMFVDTIGGCTYWFTGALAIAQFIILFMLLTRAKNIWMYVVASAGVATLGWWLADSRFEIIEGHDVFPWQYKNGFIATIYICLGGVYWKYEEKIRKLLNIWTLILLLIVYCIVSLLYLNYANCTTSLCKINIYGVILSVWGSILLIELCRHIPQKNWLSFIGQQSIGFYFLSGALPTVISMLLNKYMKENFIVLIMIFLLCMLFSYIIVYLLNRYFSFLFDLRRLWCKSPKNPNYNIQ